MSTQSTVDSGATEQTWQEIRQLVDEIVQLSRRDLSTDEFYQELLSRVVSALAGLGGVAWTFRDGGQIQLQSQVNLDRAGLINSEEKLQQHSQVLQSLIKSKEPMLLPPQSGGADELKNPTDLLLVLSPVMVEEEVTAIVEVFQRPDSRPQAQRGYLRFLHQMCTLAAEYHKNQQFQALRQRQALWSDFQEFTQKSHGSLDITQTAYTVANEGRRLIDSDRVSVAMKYGGRYKLEAISGQDTINRRSNTVRLLQTLIKRAMKAGEPLWYLGDAKDIPPQIEKALQSYLDESHTRALVIFPLEQQVKSKTPDGNVEKKERPKIIGALVIEQFDDVRIDDSKRQRIDTVRQHASIAMENSITYNSLFLLPLWRLLGKATWFIKGRTLPKTLIVVTLIVAAVLALIYVPYDFELEAKGALQPETRREIFAGMQGDVEDVKVKHGSFVDEGDVLVELRNRELERQIGALEGEIETISKKIESIAGRLPAMTNPVERSQLEAEREEARMEMANLVSQRKMMMEQQEDLVIRSPLAGEVTTWEVDKLLTARPVQRGNFLMTVAKLDGNWVLEVYMPEDRMGYVMEAHNDPEIKKDAKVTFMLATEAGTEYEGTIKSIARASEVHEEHGNCVRMVVEIDETELPALRPGAGVSAKVYCGKKPIGFVYLHDLWEFIQSRILWRL
ncbi:Efflux RND transporter periplasmic adaptor subunit [Planctomycetales bacterium 10988]|nr:Efflux RND transporter periplasmic adaptor subunit [Planctomycetales bacterium 10988]